MLRGINKQVMFAEDEDRQKFLSIVAECRQKCGCRLYAYCLMGNHVHLLIEENGEPIDRIMKKIGSTYVSWYNLKYSRSGHLFQDRFRSEPVDDDEYFYTVIRYIHQNPVKAGLSDDLHYRFSSFREYLRPEENNMVDADIVLAGTDREAFIRSQYTDGGERCLDVPETTAPLRVTDEKAQMIINKISKTENISEFQTLAPEVQVKNIVKCHKKGVSIRQLSRMTGVPKGIIERMLKNKK